MYHVGLLVHDSHTDSQFLCRARVVQCISDIRGEEKVLLTKSTPAFYGCFYCWIVGYRACRKTVYCGHHTALPLNHPLRPRLAALCRRNGQEQGLEVNSTFVPAPRTHWQLQQGILWGCPPHCSCTILVTILLLGMHFPCWLCRPQSTSCGHGHSQHGA